MANCGAPGYGGIDQCANACVGVQHAGSWLIDPDMALRKSKGRKTGTHCIRWKNFRKQPMPLGTRDHPVDDMCSRPPNIEASGHEEEIESGLLLKFAPLDERPLYEGHIFDRLVIRLADDPAPSVGRPKDMAPLVRV